MTALRTYEDHLREQGKVTDGLFICPNPECKTPPQPAFALVESEEFDWVCSTCHIEAAKAAEPPPVVPDDPWDSELGNWIRAQRIQYQNTWRWTVMPDSPLTREAQDECMAYLKLLNTLTIDYTSPDDVVWPVEPILTGDDYATDA